MYCLYQLQISCSKADCAFQVTEFIPKSSMHIYLVFDSFLRSNICLGGWAWDKWCFFWRIQNCAMVGLWTILVTRAMLMACHPEVKNSYRIWQISPFQDFISTMESRTTCNFMSLLMPVRSLLPPWGAKNCRNELEVTLICAKSKCAPLKPLTGQRLELQATVFGSRALQTIRQKHANNIDKGFLWSDSNTVIK